jgi:hypothetical protein
MTPTLIKRDRDLGWIAATPPDHAYRIAAFGASKQEAIERLSLTVAAWDAIPVTPQ